MAHVGRVSDEVYKGIVGGVKENSPTRLGWIQAKLLELLAQLGVRDFNLTEVARVLDVDVRRLHQAVVYLMKRNIVARLRRGWYKLLVDPWELLKAAVVQGPNNSKAKGVKENHGTRSVVRGSDAISVAGLYFDNVRGYAWSGGYVRGDRDGGGRCRVLAREDLVRFSRISYAEVSVATGTRLFEGLGSITIYYKCKGHGSQVVCSDWVEWRPPKGFYKQHSIVDAVNIVRSKVLPYGFGLIARAASVVGAPVDKLRAAVYGLARQLYLALRSGLAGGLG
ncbi:MAG: hypothetical protein LM558_00625 [Thermosphaera sp.]|nr:hypothetical protein [Thermosphaera sp.]